MTPVNAPRRYWRTHEEAVVLELYANTPTAEIAKRLGFSLERVYQKAWALGLHKSQEFLRHHGKRLNGHDGRGTQHQFQPGREPWNKGLKGMPPLSPETVFKRGNRHGIALSNWVPIGSVRINTDGYLVRKIADAINVPQHHNWRAVHRVVFEQAHGPVPASHAVVFKAGRKTTVLEEITLDALEMISRAELMHRNSVQRYPEELRKLVQLRGALTRVINNQARDGTQQEETTP